MTTNSLTFAALTFDCADPAALADFWGNVLGRPASPGMLAGDYAVAATDPERGPRLVLHPVSAPEAVTSRLRPIVVTDDHDAETERSTALGASVRPASAEVPAAARLTTFADPEGNEFDLVTFPSS